MSVAEGTELVGGGAGTITPVTIGRRRGGPPLSTVLRRDRWWVAPTLTAIGLLAFIAYATWAAFRNDFYYAGNVGRDYLSPFYSPCVTDNCAGPVWGPIIGSWWQVSPALLILIFPLGFRLTCYYYRKAYYRSFWLSPPACAVADSGSAPGPGGRPPARPHYTGETRFPLVIQNIHRYFWYVALAFAGILTWDAMTAFRFPDGIGVGLGTIIFVVNAVLIWLYTVGCHACRHLCGGGAKTFSSSRVRYELWKLVTPLNGRHTLFAWLSLVWIAFTDFYVWLVASGTIHDPRLF
jgi:hypothetical protein